MQKNTRAGGVRQRASPIQCVLSFCLAGPAGGARQAGARRAAGTSPEGLSACQFQQGTNPLGVPTVPETCSFWPKRCRCPSTFPAANGCNRVFTGEDGRDWGDRIAWLPSKCPSLVLSFINSFSLKFLYFGSWSRRKNLECLTLTGPPFRSSYCMSLLRSMKDCHGVGANLGVIYFSRVSKGLQDLQEQKGHQATRQVSHHSLSICLSMHIHSSFLSLSVCPYY